MELSQKSHESQSGFHYLPNEIVIQFTLHLFVWSNYFHFIFNKNIMNEFVFLYRGAKDGPAPSPEAMETYMKRWQT